MAKTCEINEYFERVIPSTLRIEDDNVGLLVDNAGSEITKALVALDITNEVIDEACELGAGLILSHHPLFFGLREIKNTRAEGMKIIKLISNNISAICLHTNLDCVMGGVSDCLLAALGAQCGGILELSGTAPDGAPYGIGRFGELPVALTMQEFLTNTKTALKTGGLRYHDSGRPVKKIACCGGSGGDYIEAVVLHGCDTYVTADLKYNVFQEAAEFGLNIIDGDHFCTENVVIPYLAGKLSEGFPEIEVKISELHGQIVKFF